MNNLQRVAGPIYLFAIVMVLFPLLDILHGVWPLQLGEVGWRLTASNLISRTTLFPLLGFFLAFGAAVILEHPRVLRMLSVLCGLLAMILAVGTAVFLLDALQMRTQVALDARSRYDLGALIASAKFGVGFFLLVFLAVSQWKGAGAVGQAVRKVQSTPTASLVAPGGRSQKSRSTETEGG